MYLACLTEIKHDFSAPFKITGFVTFAESVLVSHWLTLEGPDLCSGSVTLGLHLIWIFSPSIVWKRREGFIPLQVLLGSSPVSHIHAHLCL